MAEPQASLKTTDTTTVGDLRSVPSMEESYRRDLPLLLGALAKLAAKGYAVPPQEGMDLIHDFYADLWRAITAKYDPERARYQTYLYACFVRFARPRIIRMLRWHYSITDPKIIVNYMESRSNGDESPSESSVDVQLVRRIIKRLPDLCAPILIEYLGDERSSEREIANKFSITRYRVRELLAEAFGRIAVGINEAGAIPEGDWQVLLALWRENRTVKETASQLDRAVSEVQKTNTRAFKLVREAAKYH